MLKTILVIDSANNCAYDCFGADDMLFSEIFPGESQDIEFIEDFLKRHPGEELDFLFDRMWRTPIPRQLIRGIDGILFYDLLHKKEFYPNKKDSDLDLTGRAFSYGNLRNPY
jgi:hypothetical protein